MITRRKFINMAGLAGVGAMLPWKNLTRGLFADPLPGGTLNPLVIPKYRAQLFVPPAMPSTSSNYYEIGVRQFQQQVLPSGMPLSTVWGYGSVNHPASFRYICPTIEARFEKKVRVKWINELKKANGEYLPHLLPVDQTLHWANPPGGASGRDSMPTFTSTPGAYTGPVPLVSHLHGAHSAQESDGYPEAWFLPAASNLPSGFAREGTWYNTFRDKFRSKTGVNWQPGTATFEYTNDQAAGNLWFHDHSLGMSRLNVYAGPVGMYMIRGGDYDLTPGVLPGPAPAVGANPYGRHYEIPLVIQDRSFNQDGSLFYPDSRFFFDGYEGPSIPDTDLPPMWNPEFFANTMVVNGNTWPTLNVEPRRYRFRVLNACNSRFLILKLVSNPLAVRPATAHLPFWQIGADGGFLRAPAMLDQLLMAPAERADIIVDLSGLTVGTKLYLINEGPDEPFGGGMVGTDFFAADPESTGQVMELVVVPLHGRDKSKKPENLHLPEAERLEHFTKRRVLSLNELVSMTPGPDGGDPWDGPVAAMLGTVDGAGAGVPKRWSDPITETPRREAIEIWELRNFTEDAHPIHIHQVQFEVVNRQSLDGGVARPPEAGETGVKDTVIAYPGEVTRFKARFDLKGLYTWHCHILEHEDNEMMRPIMVKDD